MPDTVKLKDGTELDGKVVKVMKAIRQIESGGDYNAVGDLDKGVSRGAYQFNKDNFKNWAKEYNLDPNDFSPANQNKVAYARIKKFKDEGKQPEEIAALWNGAKKTPDGRYTYINPQYGERFRAALQQTNQPTQSSGLGGNYPAPPEVKSFTPAQGTDTTQPQQDKNIVQKGLEFLFPILEQKERTPLQFAGDIGMSALTLVPGLGLASKGLRAAGLLAKGVEAASGAAKAAEVAPSILKSVGKNAALGYGVGTASNLSEGQSLQESVLPNISNVGGAVIGGGVAGVLGRSLGGASALRKGAEKDIADILSPTTKVNKQLTQKIAPRLAKEVPFAPSRESLLGKIETNLGKAGEQLDEAYETLPKDAQFEVTGLFETLQKKIDDLTVNGVVPSAAKSKVEAYQDMMRDLANIGIRTTPGMGGLGKQVFSDVANVRKLRQLLDAGKRSYSFTDFDAARQGAQKQLANSIRGEFAKQFPDIDKINKDFNFWSNAAEVLGAAIERKTGQTGLLRKGIAAGLGMGAGAVQGHPIVGGAIMKLLSDFIGSPAWNTTTARVKSKLADALEKADYVGAQKIIEGALKLTPIVGARAVSGVQGLISPSQIYGQ